MFKKAFTLIELLVVVAVIAILVTILVPVVTTAIEDTERTVCANNLKVIGKAYYDYAQENEANPFPMHDVDSAPDTAGDEHAALSGDGGSNTLADIHDNAMNTVWVLISQGLLPATAFKCPGDEGYTERMIDKKYGWDNSTEFSYGVQYPYASDGTNDNPADPAGTYTADDATVEPVAKKGDEMYLSNWILMADRNPGAAVDETAAIEHSNHKGGEGGCSVVTKIGNVSFYQQEWKSMAGFGDDIYTDCTAAGVETCTGSSYPRTRSDTIISPTVSR